MQLIFQLKQLYFILSDKFQKNKAGFVPVLGLLLAVCFLHSCTYYNEEELYGIIICDTNNVSYTESIAPILQDNCVSCHNTDSNYKGIILDNQDGFIEAATNGPLLNVINHESGFTPMPDRQPKLSDCNITLIEKWLRDEGHID